MIDFVQIQVKAGDGGDGLVHFHRSKFRPKGGPDGGDGGDGGSVILKTDPNLNTLLGFRYKKKFEAASGRPGGINKRSGKDALDLMLKVPVGTIVRDEGSGEEMDLSGEEMEVTIALGGHGGRGNWRFRSATNQVPLEFEPGTEGQEKNLVLELKLLAEVGLVGLPNVGKSSLLAVLTEAKPVIANYPFTTLEPNLGVMAVGGRKEKQGLVIADIPGLIEGASKGKGLGDEFLRHVERTRLLLHVLGVEIGGGIEQLWRDYEVIRREMAEYNKSLLKKKELIVVNKSDLLDEGEAMKITDAFAKKGMEVVLVSAGTTEGIEELKKKIALLTKKSRSV